MGAHAWLCRRKSSGTWDPCLWWTALLLDPPWVRLVKAAPMMELGPRISSPSLSGFSETLRVSWSLGQSRKSQGPVGFRNWGWMQ